MSRPVLHRAALPDRENEIVFDPPFSQWPALLRENGQMTSAAVDVARKELMQSASDYTREILGVRLPAAASSRVIATGHQCIWHHCGIWAKNAAACKLAEAAGGTAVHLVLDHDVRNSSLVAPQSGSDDSSALRTVELEQGLDHMPIECRPAPERARIEAFVTAACKATRDPVCGTVWPDWIRRLDARPGAFTRLADVITAMQGALNLSLGLNLLYLPVSRLSESAAFLAFAADLLWEAPRFAAQYNDATGPAGQADVRPLRAHEAARTELPFWLVLPGGRRESLWVEPHEGGRIGVGIEGQRIDMLDASCESDRGAEIKAVLVRHQCRLRPKAVTLTLFARMVLADWFVHGIGAQRYETVTDLLMDRWYDRPVSHFGVATCTMRLPVGPSVSEGASAREHRLHHMQHNPEKYLSPEQRRQDWISRLVEEKAISLLRLGSDAEDAGRKKATYARLRQINEQLFRCIAADLVPSLQDAGRRRSTAISPGAFDTREFFFGLFPTERLEAVAAGAGAPDEGLPDDEVADNIGPPAPRDCERATFSR